jgi:CDP-diacylglycerol--serine O-phosphatidyltransferase
VKIRKHIPNILTCTNLAFGCYACILALNGDSPGAITAILVAAGFDFADGLAARLLHAYSPIGKDLDSLADMVSFGVAPGMMLFDFVERVQQTADWSYPAIGSVFWVAALAVPVFSALRLAKFNNDGRQTNAFIGLPVPAHALLWASLIHVLASSIEGIAIAGIVPQFISLRLPEIPALYMLLAVSLTAIASSLLLVSEVHFFSLKIKSLAWKGNELCCVLGVASAVAVACFGFAGIAVAVLLYILLSVVNHLCCVLK